MLFRIVQVNSKLKQFSGMWMQLKHVILFEKHSFLFLALYFHKYRVLFRIVQVNSKLKQFSGMWMQLKHVLQF